MKLSRSHPGEPLRESAGRHGGPGRAAGSLAGGLLSRVSGSLAARILLSTVAVGLVIAATAGILVYRAARADQIAHAERGLLESITTAEDRLASRIDITRRDVLFLSRLPDIATLVRELADGGRVDGADTAALRDRVAAIFAGQIDIRPEFLQMRLIGVGDGGREVVRVDRLADGEIIRVPDGELQRKGDRDYFQATVGLAAGVVYQSRFELKRELGAVEVPHRPIYRLATPVFYPEGSVRGILIANVDTARLFELSAGAVSAAASFFITNPDGDYLRHPDTARTFGFDLGTRYLIQDDIPEVGAIFGKGKRTLQARVDLESGRHVLVARRSHFSLDRPSRYLVTAALLPYSSIVSGSGQLIGTAVVIAAVMVLAAAAAALVLLHLVARPIELTTRAAADLAAGSRHARLDELLGRTDEVGVMARTFEQMADTIRRREEEVTARSQDLARSNRELVQFAYLASHDLQEPLRMVASYLGLLSRRYKGKLDADADEFIGYAVDGAERMKGLINGLLGYSRVSNRELDVKPGDSRAVVERMLAVLADRIDAGAEIVIGDLPTVPADEPQLERLITNLVDNALKYRSAAPLRLHISARRTGRFWEFSVADNGIGIDPKFRGKVFEIFARLHGREKYPGTGIGLSSCRRIVERHGGEIRVEPSPAGGSDFRFTLPAS